MNQSTLALTFEKAAQGIDGRKYPLGNQRDVCYSEVFGCAAVIMGYGKEIGQWERGKSIEMHEKIFPI